MPQKHSSLIFEATVYSSAVIVINMSYETDMMLLQKHFLLSLLGVYVCVFCVSSR